MTRQVPWLRVFVEGVVIVGSILLAFGIDAWWTERGERITERQYLERLLEDVRYDRAENQLVMSIMRSGLERSDSLIELIENDGVRSLQPERLVHLFLRASDDARPDYSRATYQELVNSGRIELIRSPNVRAALANYDRSIENQSGQWDSPRVVQSLYPVRVRSIPADILTRWLVTCRGEPQEACRLDLGDWSAGALVERLSGPQTIGDVRGSMSYQSGVVLVVQYVLDPAASELEQALLSELGPER